MLPDNSAHQKGDDGGPMYLLRAWHRGVCPSVDFLVNHKMNELEA
jgi:hypothetical protein